MIQARGACPRGDAEADAAVRLATEKRGWTVGVLTPYRAIFQVILIIIAIALMISILLQARGAGLGSVFGGSGTVFKTRRGIEKLLFNMTVFFAIVFMVLSFFTAAIPS